MASIHSPQRQPLLDRRLQALIRQRGKEMLGIGLICLGAMMALILASYSPDDPSWMASTDAPVQNALGRVGAAIASPVTIILGHAGWGIVLALSIWGLRLIVHRGEGNIAGRSVFLPIAVAVSAIWLATLVPGPGWQMDFGLGGMFGDTILGALLTAMPLATTAGMNALTLGFLALTLALWVYVLGSSWRELYELLCLMGAGIVLSYAALIALLNGGARGLGRGLIHGARGAARAYAARRAARRHALATDDALLPQGAAGWRAGRAAPGGPLVFSRPAVAKGTDPSGAPGDLLTDPRVAAASTNPAMPASAIPAPTRRDSRVLRAENAPASASAPIPPLHAGGPVTGPGTGLPLPGATGWRDTAPTAATRLQEPPLHGGTPPMAYPAVQTAMPGQVMAPQAPFAAPAAGHAGWAAPAQKPGLLARVSALGRRLADPVTSQAPPAPGTEPPVPQGSAERIRSRISDAIRARQRQTPVLRVPQPAPAQPGAATRGPLFPVPPRQQPALSPAPATTDWPAQTANTPPHAPMAAPQRAAEPPLRSPAPMPSAAQLWPAATLPLGSDPYGADSFGGDPYDDAAPYAPAPQSTPRPAAPATPLPAADPVIEDDDEVFVVASPAMPQPQPTPEAGTGHVLNRRVVQTGRNRPPAPSRRAQAEAQPSLRFRDEPPAYELPPLGLLADPDRVERFSLSDDALEENARMLESVLDDYGVRGEIVAVRPGPVVTLYELEPAPGLKASRVIGLADDIARSMSALSARVSTVPGRSVIGIELPNARREKVVLREILACRDFGDTQQRLPIALGKDIGGEPVVANLAKMPHLLIAGTTGSGKSVAINTMILSLLYRLTPAECRLIMIDPKMLELSVYDGIPHLLSPVVTDPKKAVVALKWVVGEMEERYRKMSKMGVRNIEGYNGRVREALERGEMFKRTVQTGFDDETGDPVFETEEFAPEALPFIVVIVDEMADLMMVAGKEIEACIQRLAQMARASGIHLIMATQRPSVDVITGTIKANFPTRISFQVTSKIDSRTILGEQGAEQLLGMGDMLYMAGGAKITRIHGPFVSDEEVEEVVTHLKSFGPPDYQSGVLEGPDSEREADIDAVLGLGDGASGDDALYDQAVAIVAKDRKCSTSYIQRKLGIGYNKAARLVEQMEEQGVVSPANHVGKREVLVPEA